MRVLKADEKIIIFGLIFAVLIFAVYFSFSKKSSKESPIENKTKTVVNKMKFISPAIFEGELLAKKYTCDGENVNPALEINLVPEGTKSLALIVDDPDAPVGIWTHWLLWNISPETKEIKENSVPLNSVQGQNDSGTIGYSGPCPPKGPYHRYFFRLYALDTTLNLTEGAKRRELDTAMQGHILGKIEIFGRYSR